MTLPSDLADRLKLPAIAAPMFLVSGPDLVIAACRAGVIGSFPTPNCRTVADLDQWLDRITAALGPDDAPFSANLIVHRTNRRLGDDLASVVRHRVPLVIASVGSPEHVIGPIHDYGGFVFADVASLRHAEKAVAVGADGLILLTAGAGGQTGWANPFAFVRAVRGFYDGPLVLAGGVGDGTAIHAARALGCDLAYLGTRFIATAESLAPAPYKQMLVASRLDDIVLTRAITGLQTSILRPSLIQAGLDPDNLPDRGSIEVNEDIDADAPKRWKDIWSAGHSVSGVDGVPPVADLVARLIAEYQVARAAA